MSKWQWVLRQFTRKLWVRISLFCLAGILTAFTAYIFRGFIPDDVSRKVGADAVDNILQIIASSMLAVTTFSLSTMVAAYAAATSNATPRATRLLLEDNTTQNALSTFIGSFLFSLVGIIALSMNIYGDSGRLILFAVTLLVIVVIIIMLIRWINYLSRLGRVGQTIDMVERAARQAIQQRLEAPYLGGVPLDGYQQGDGHLPLTSPRIGYLQHIDVGALNGLAENAGIDIYVRMLPGSFNDGLRPLAMLSEAVDEETMEALLDAFSFGDDRSFDQDPRFGLIVLGEIASRALSPGINDPGTAIDIIGTAVRVLAPWVQATPTDAKPRFVRVHVPSVTLMELFDDIFRPIARDGAGMVEVGIRLQKALASLAAMGSGEAAAPARRHSEMALKRAGAALAVSDDLELLTSVATLMHKPASEA